MSKVGKVLSSDRSTVIGVYYDCPGCKERHALPTVAPSFFPNGHLWTWNGSMDKPSLSPSINRVGLCHHFVQDGRIQFLTDCRHALAGTTVDLADVDYVDDDQ